MSEKTRVLYDISVLGTARVNERARTGVFRVVDQVARDLLARDDIDLNWTAYGNANRLWEVVELLRDDPSLDRPLCASLRGRRAFDWLCWPIEYLASTHPYKLVRRTLPLIRRMRRRVTISKRHLRGAQIVHSPFFALPDCTAGATGPVRFLTVHDLIAIKFPELCNTGTPELLRHTLDSVRRDDWVLCNSEHTRNDLLDYRPDLDPDQVRVTHLAAADHFTRCEDVERIGVQRRKLGLDEQARYFLSVCTLEPRKNLRHLVSVFDEVVAQFDDDTYLVLVGPKGWQIDELINDLARADESKVITAGYVADEDLAPLYGGAIAFVYPSLYEGFGLPILEALQCGTPVIASGNSAIPEVVGDAGILVRADSRDELADAMLRVSGDAALRSTLESAGLARSKLFSWQRCGDSTVQAYRDALQIPSRARRPTRQKLDSSNKKLARSAIPGVERDGTRGGATSPS